MKILPRCYVCCLLLLVIAGAGGRNILRSTDRHNVSSLTVTHVINQTEPLCREFFPDYQTLRFLAYPTPTFHKDKTACHLWAVDCMDAEGSHLLYVVWDEDRQQLIQICRSQDLRHGLTPILPISVPQALRIARDWVLRLHMATWKEVQSSRSRPRRLNGVMNINFYLPSRSVRVAMVDSGEVRGVFTSNISEHSVSSPAANTPAATPAYPVIKKPTAQSASEA